MNPMDDTEYSLPRPSSSPFRAGSGSSSISPSVPQMSQAELIQHIHHALQEGEARYQQRFAQFAAASAAPSANADPQAIAAALAAALALTQPIELPTFTAAGTAAGIAAHSWLQRVDLKFAERAVVAGLPSLPDGHRIAAASSALAGGASSWYTSLTTHPTTWAEFKAALLHRFQPASALKVYESQLNHLVSQISKIREKLNTHGLEQYTQRFQTLANHIPSDKMLDRTKILKYAEGLPLRLREFICSEEEKVNLACKPFELNTIIDKVLIRSATREVAGGLASASSSSAPSSSSSSSDAMDISATESCRRNFNISAEEAASYIEPAEGWAEHETSSFTSPGATTTHSSSTAEARLIQQVNSLQAQLAAMSRRTVSPPVKREVPEQLAADRRDAGLCVRCGVVKYEAGGKGHNSRTCTKPVDVTTSAVAGKKAAGLK